MVVGSYKLFLIEGLTQIVYYYLEKEQVRVGKQNAHLLLKVIS